MGILELMRLDGKKAFVTGGARGIGKAIATALAEAGSDVAIIDIDTDEANKTALGIASLTGRNIIAITADVTSQLQVNRMIDEVIAAFGEINVAFCNAGISKNIPAEDMSLEDWNKVLDINLTGVFLCAQSAGRQMIKQGNGGSIINTASMSAHIVNLPQPQCAYNASKAGVVQLTKSLAVEWIKYKIRVNSISPGYIATDMIMNNASLIPMIKEWNKMSPSGRLGTPEELQAISVYLAGNTSTFTTGSDFIIDGAFTCV